MFHLLRHPAVVDNYAMTLNVRTFSLTVLLTLAAATGLAQQVNVSMGSATGTPGSVVNVPLQISSSGGAQPTGIQWKLTPGNGISSVTFTPSSDATLAGKSITCTTGGSSIDCILFGLNTSVLSNGAIATAAITIASGTGATSASLALSAVMASSGAGTSIPTTTSNGLITISQPVQQTYTISGTISNGASATVTLSGAASRSTTANSSGAYSFTGLVNGSYTVTPSRSGYSMSPASQAVAINNANATANFTASQQTYTISGTISNGSGATVALSGAASRTATANSSGAYSFTGLVNGNYTVTPTRSGYTMSPTSRAVAVNSANATANFTATQQQVGQVTLSMGTASGAPGAVVNANLTLAISGSAQPIGLQWRLTPGTGISSVTFTPSAAVTAAGKSIQCSPNGGSIDCVLYGMNSTALTAGTVATAAVTISSSASASTAALDLSATVASSSAGTPISSTETDGAVTITAPSNTTYTISGTITGGASSTVTLSGAASRTTTANSSGVYSFTGLANGSYTVTPSRAGFTFTPSSRPVAISGANQTANFTATQQTWGISGVVSGGNATLALSGPVNLTTTTDANGNYSFSGLINGSYTLTPTRTGYSFTPTSRSLTINSANQTGINFTSAQQSWSISGTITNGGNATVALSGAASRSVTADSSGNYAFTGVANGTYTVTPTLANRTMTPASRSVTVNGANATGTNFTASTTSTSGPSVDVTVSRNYTSSTNSMTAPTFSTKSANQILLAFIATDNTRSTQTVRSVSGGPLNWRLAVRTNRQGGTSEIWYAIGAQTLSSVSVSANLAQRAEGHITVMSFANVDTSNSGLGAIGAIVSSSSTGRAPGASISPSRAGSIVIGVGSDPQTAAARVPLSGQRLVHQLVVSNQGTTWVQRFDAPPPAGHTVVLGASSPSSTSYDMSVVEIRGSLYTTTGAPPPALVSEAAPTASGSPSAEAEAGAATPASVALVHPVTFEAAEVCSPGGLATLAGTDFTKQTPVSISNTALPAAMNGARVQVNGQDARLMLVGPDQINFQCPDLPAGTALDIAVLGEHGKLQRAKMSVMQTAAPALFTLSGSKQAVVQRLDESEGNGPIRSGDRIRLFLSGLGTVKEPVAAGALAPSDRPIAITNPLTVVLNGVELTPAFAGLAPGTAGLYQVDVQLPEGTQAGAEIPVSVKLYTPDGRAFLSNLATLKISQAARTRH